MSTENHFTDGSDQFHWIESDLASVDRCRTPWLVFVGHRPMYINADDFFYPEGKQTTAIELQAALEHLLHKHKVDVAFYGHHHSYQRTCPVFHKKCRHDKHGHRDAPVHVCIGNAGADFYDNPMDPTPKWADKVFMTTHGYARFFANGTVFQVQAVDTEGNVFDDFSLMAKSGKHCLSRPLLNTGAAIPVETA
jgi:acid phosphatase type 7